jgi:16S rRNA (adenine1518-N6/adenine1519-N6)-dimethyltransferase
VLEIGPGLGPLTELLLERAGEVLAIEKDFRLVDFLKDSFSLESRTRPDNAPLEEAAGPSETTDAPAMLGLMHDDALDFIRREQRDWSQWKLVANLPYSVASPILVELAQGERSPKRIVATLQFEVAKRVMAKADDDDYGLLTLLLQIDYETQSWFKIPASCFFPEPEVDSACICLIRRSQPAVTMPRRKAFNRLVKLAFSQRRKMMMKLLKQDWPVEKLGKAFEQLQLSPQIRAEAVEFETFVQLNELLQPHDAKKL